MSDPSAPPSPVPAFPAELNDTNFYEWREDMMALLMVKRLWQYVVADHDADDPADQQAKGFIWISLEHSQRSHVPPGADAHLTWTALCAHHERVVPRVIADCIFGISASTG